MRPKHVWLGAAAVAIAAAAVAQDKPESILPPGFDEPASPTSPSPAATKPAVAAPAEVSSGKAAASPAVEGVMQDLLVTDGLATEESVRAEPVELPIGSERDPALAGVLSPTALGIGERPWGRAGGEFLEVLMRRMDTPLASRWAHIALRNLALAKAAPPGALRPADWVAERAWLLLRMGEADAARLLVASVDVADYTPKLTQVAMQTALANSDPSALCPLEGRLDKVEARVAPLVGAICSSLSGDSEAAASDIERARRRGKIGGIDLALADKLVGAGADSARAVQIQWDPVEYLTNWRFGLATATGMLPPERLFKSGAPRMQAWLARSPMIAPADRIGAARMAAGLGVLSSEAMVDLYAQLYDQTDPDALGDSDAWQLRLAYVGKDLDTRLGAMRRLWDGAKGATEKQAMRVTLARAASRVPPSASLGADAPALVESMLAAGFDKEAARWAPFVGKMDDGDADRVWAMLAVAAPGTSVDLSKGRIESFIDRDDSDRRQRSRLLVAGLAGLGRITPQLAGDLNRQYGLGLGATTLWTRLIDGASVRRQAGTAMVLAASGLQGASFERVGGLYLFHAVNALRRTNQEYTARMIAAEALART